MSSRMLVRVLALYECEEAVGGEGKSSVLPIMKHFTQDFSSLGC